jgi:cystathionine gamma-synthase
MPLSRSDLDALRPGTRTLHAGDEVLLGNAQPTVPPIHTATAFTYPTTSELDEVFEDNSKGYVYSRYGNPTVRALEVAMAAVEGTEDAVVFGSGMAAIHAVIAVSCAPGQKVLVSRDVYGATFGLLRSHFAPLGIEPIFADFQDLPALAELANSAKPALILAETISNPLLRVVDVAAVAGIANSIGATFLLDNTFASPVVTRGINHGADAIIHSSTKHIGGHGDTTGGIVATSADLAHRLREQNKLVGNVASPFDAWLTLRGLRTLELRVRQQCRNAAEIAAWLEADPRIDRVYYPGLSRDIPAAQFIDGLHGSMLSFEVKGADRADVFAILEGLRIVKPATTLGDVASLCLHPATSSHRGLSAEERAEIGIAEGLIRVSAGIEDIRDIIADLDQAIGVVSGARTPENGALVGTRNA